jgi:hypothetical protein
MAKADGRVETRHVEIYRATFGEDLHVDFRMTTMEPWQPW